MCPLGDGYPLLLKPAAAAAGVAGDALGLEGAGWPPLLPCCRAATRSIAACKVALSVASVGLSGPNKASPPPSPPALLLPLLLACAVTCLRPWLAIAAAD